MPKNYFKDPKACVYKDPLPQLILSENLQQ